MLRFRVFRDGLVPPDFDISTAYLVGSDNVPIRGEFAYVDGEIQCRKRAAGPAALTLLWETRNFGKIMLETTRLPEREEPYLLNLELARSRMMRMLQKREEWGLFDVAEGQPINEKSNDCRDLLLQAIVNLEDMAQASNYADQCLNLALPLSEQAAMTHADLLLQRRLATRSFPRGAFGSCIDPALASESYRRLLLANSDFAYYPLRWKDLEPQEQSFAWPAADEWMDFLRRARIPVVAGPLVQFNEQSIPDWLYMWEHDYENVRDLLYEHIERIVSRYSQQVVLWNVLSGLHVNAQFSFTFDQLMDLTRMAVGQVKKINPQSRTMIELTQPWGEYYAINQRSIPPLLYAEMIVQSGIVFDMFGVQIRFGMPRDGCWQRDLFQISSMLDRFAPLGKPLMISGLQVPSAVDSGTNGQAAGIWRKPWSDTLQSKWVEAVTNIALSKPFVEAVCWQELADHPHMQMRNGGLVSADLTPKLSYKTWVAIRRNLVNYRATPPGTASVPAASTAPKGPGNSGPAPTSSK